MNSTNSTLDVEPSVLYWTGWCGNRTQDDAIWSDLISVDTFRPDFTRCFQKTILCWIPTAYMLIACCVYIPILVKRRSVNKFKYTSKFNLSKLLLCILLICIALVNLINRLVDENTGENRPVADLMEAICYLFIYLLAAFLTHYEFRKGVHSGGVMFVLWSLLVIILIVPFRSIILHLQDNTPIDVMTMVSFFLSYCVIAMLFVCSLFSDLQALPHIRRRNEEKLPLIVEPEMKDYAAKSNLPSPEITAPFWSQMTFFWITGMIVQGYKRTLEFKDLWTLMPADRSSTIVPKFMGFWYKEVKKYDFQMVNRRADESKIIRFEDISSSGKTKLSHITDNVFKNAFNPPRAEDPGINSIHRDERKKNKKLPSIWTVIVKTFGAYYCIGGLHNLVYTLLLFVSPILLNLIITFVAVPNAYEWQGYLFVFALFAVNCLKTIFNVWYWHMCYEVGLRVRTAVIAIIYRKALRLNNSAKRKSTVGEIVNLMSVDAQKLQEAPAYLHLLW